MGKVAARVANAVPPNRFLRAKGQRTKLRLMSTRFAFPCVLTIGGTDPSGGAGLPADARAIKAFGAHSCPIVTAIVAQNTRGVRCMEPVSSGMLRAQLENLLEDIKPCAIKIGLVANVEHVEVLRDVLSNWRDVPIVLDPVFAPSTGEDFSDLQTIQAIAQQLFPLCALVTPNAVEAERLCGFPISNVDDMKNAARAIQKKYGANRVLIKGGHLPQSAEVVDVLWQVETVLLFRAPRIEGEEVRGTGCLLSSAIAAQLAQNVAIETAIERAKSWLSLQIRDAKKIGGGRRVAV